MFINQQQTKGMKLTANPAWLSLPPNRGKGSGAKFLRIMKLTTILILAACLHTSAKGVAQQTITFSGKEVSLENVFNAIKKQTNYRFFFNTDMIQNASKVTLEVKNAQIEQVMNMALKDQPLIFTIKGRTIFIMKKPEEEKKSVQMAPTGDPITVSGRVTDENGEPLVGANVKVKGGSNGITTDNQGRFTLANVDPNATLEISFVGHETQILSVKGKTVLSVALGQRVGVLDETVVIAYGATSKRLNTGNVSMIKSEDIEKQPVNNPLLALAGRVPGIFISQSSGIAGGGVTTLIQGQNSIRSGNDPFYVIDGVPFTQQLLPNFGGMLGMSGVNNSQNGNPLSFINPNDIESISVLKGADATAIYGSRAANGAIIIVTKKGKIGKTKLDVNLQQGWGRLTRRMELLNTQQYMEMRREAVSNTNTGLRPTDYDLNGTWDSTRYTDWQKELIGGTARYTNLSASMSGGTTGVQYLIGTTFRRETSVFPGNFSDKKGSVHFTINSNSSNQKFKLQFSGNYLIDNNELPSTDLTQTSLELPPNAPALYNADGSLNWAPNSTGSTSWPLSSNPIAYTLATYQNKTNNLISNADLSYSILPELLFKTSLGFSKLESNEIAITPLTVFAPERRPTLNRAGAYANNDINTWIIEPQLLLNKSLAKGKIDALIGMTFQQESRNGYQLTGVGFNSDEDIADINSASMISRVGSTISKYKYNAVFARIGYNWNGKYLINLTGRRDGSSRFGSANQFHNFGAVGLGWIFSEEKLSKNHLGFLSYGKIRGSYGTTGNDQIGEYGFLNLYSSIVADVPYQSVVGLQPNGIPNPFLQWEETKKLDLGFDAGIMKDRILLSANYYQNRSSNQLLGYSVSIVTGVPSITTNFPATVQNYGWEFTLSSKNIMKKELEWSTDINVTIQRNKLIEFPNLSASSYANSLIVGQPVSIALVYHSLGVDPQTGRYQFADKHGVATMTPDYLTDRTVILNLTPKFYGGIENNVKFKGFELAVLLQYVNQIASNYSLGRSFPGSKINQPVGVLDRWQKVGDVKPLQIFRTSGVVSSYNSATYSDMVYSDASYLRLKNLSLSWRFPKNWGDKVGFKNITVYVLGQNLITLTDYNGMDPETKGSPAFTSLPPLKIWTVGLRATL